MNVSYRSCLLSLLLWIPFANTHAQILPAITPAAQPGTLSVFESDASIPYTVDRYLSQNNTSNVFSSFSIAPSHVVLRNQLVELRLYLLNTGSAARDVNVQFYFNSVAPLNKLMVSPRTITLRPYKDNLLRIWISPYYFPGKQTLIANISGSGISTVNREQKIFVAEPLTLAGGKPASSPFATTIWIEPGAMLTGMVPRISLTPYGYNPYFSMLNLGYTGPALMANTTSISSEHYFNYLAWLKFTGIRTIVIAYSEYQNKKYFHQASAAIPNAENVIPSFDFLDFTLSSAQTLGMNVIVGLNKGGEENLFVTVNEQLQRPGQLARPTSDLPQETKNKVSAVRNGQTQLAKDLWTKYGYRYRSFYGFYLAHESNCFDQISELNYNPLATEIRKFMPLDKVIKISPPIISRSCGSTEPMNQQIAASKADVISYQDGVGAGFVSTNGYPEKTFNYQRSINGLTALYTEKAQWHNGSNRHIWANIEIWRYIQHPEVPLANDYSQKDSFSAPLSELRSQIELAQPHTGQLMINEGLRYFHPQPDVISGAYQDVSTFNRINSYFLLMYSPSRPDATSRLAGPPGSTYGYPAEEWGATTAGPLWNSYLNYVQVPATQLRNSGM